MSFGELQLKKYGWKEGRGLGREESGISTFLKPKLKFNSFGLGHSQSEEFTFQWWDHVYNKAANNLSVQKNETGQIEIIKEQDLKVSTKKLRLNTKKNLYNGNFIKGCILEGSKIISNFDDSDEGLHANEVEKSQELIKNYSDNELFQLCGGLTGHKGARHGLTMSAKLARIEQQEKAFLGNQNLSNESEQKSKKKRKRKNEENTSDVNPKKELKFQNLPEDINLESDVIKTKKKKKSKNKAKTIVDEVTEEERIISDMSNNLCENDNSDRVHKKKKKKKHKKSIDDDNYIFQESENENANLAEITEHKKKKKRKKENTDESK